MKDIEKFININFKHYSKDIREKLILILCSMLSYYEDEELVIEAFKNINLIIVNKSISDYLNIETKKIIPATTILSDEIYIVLSNIYHFNILNELEILTHEINHVVNSIYDYDKNRCGLSQTNKRKYLTLEEAINTLQTEQIIQNMNNIKKLKKLKKDLKNYQSIAYKKITPLIRPLYQNKKMQKIIKYSRLYKDDHIILEEFNKLTNPEGYDKLNTNLDEYYFRSNKNSKDKVKQLVNTYLNNQNISRKTL